MGYPEYLKLLNIKPLLNEHVALRPLTSSPFPSSSFVDYLTCRPGFASEENCLCIYLMVDNHLFQFVVMNH